MGSIMILLSVICNLAESRLPTEEGTRGQVICPQKTSGRRVIVITRCYFTNFWDSTPVPPSLSFPTFVPDNGMIRKTGDKCGTIMIIFCLKKRFNNPTVVL
ncbi:hypothetical protein SPSIL_013590 [Sporomusa silvacetica DSM 10669]|uniref:Secreted protein n=1 Tax=Sporomusa silvacetica DSM 10669 TaxID=1123289 RepID=A0ABZ3II08_9FIRM|nr:hypothetical protein SPSIL_36040 [Sporomusa silvacetica DSM 10669]